MNLRHAKAHATRQARLIAGDLYPGPILMPKGLLRAIDPILAIATGPARREDPAFKKSFEATLRGRPDGPLLLALWASITGGEINHNDLRKIIKRMPNPLPQQPASQKETLDWIKTKARPIARCILALAQQNEKEAEEFLENLICGVVLTHWIINLPSHLSQGSCPLPLNTTGNNKLSIENLEQCVHSQEINDFLKKTTQWADALLIAGLPIHKYVGSRFARDIKALTLRAQKLLQQVNNPKKDFFRTPPSLNRMQRLECATRAWIPTAI